MHTVLLCLVQLCPYYESSIDLQDFWVFLFNVYFGKFVMTFIDIGEIGCMSILKFHCMVIVVICLLVWFYVCRVSIGYSRL